ncbi:hypothetical protein V5799_019855 [Amblyomma americanum]|uniref:Uncharacterized protein n=1 Tax=Amblyomma americanum TaxID=6943 RepID=A0AAQ4EVC2_AMBAM
MKPRCLLRFRRRLVRVAVLGMAVHYGYYLWKWRIMAPTRAPRGPASHGGGWQRVRPVGYRIRTPGCVVPQFDPSVKPYFIRRSNGSRCHGRPNFLTVRNGFPVVLPQKLKEHGVVQEDLLCFYKQIYRHKSARRPDNSYFLGPKQPLHFDKPLTNEFLLVECGTRQTPESRFHNQLLLNPVKKKKRRKALSRGC